jgi:predicted DNA-binding transcriptional regulator YafY
MRDRLIKRLARLMVLCQSRRHLPPFAVLSRQLGVSERTLMRDLAALSDAGFPVPVTARDYYREVA